MRAAHARDLAVEFNNAISRRDLSRLGDLMTEDHKLVTGPGDPVNGKDACIRAWSQFFELLPDYRNVFERVWSVGEVVRMQGRSVCTDERLNGPAIWKAIVEGTRISEWHVDEDTPEGRQRLGHEAGKD
jgi:ketosteroid isomerase-like protein